MPETWTGNLIGRMHNKGITYDELAAEMGGWKGVHFHDPEWAAEAHRYQETHGDAVNTIIQRRSDGTGGAVLVNRITRRMSNKPD